MASAHSAHCPVAAMENREKKLYAVQFHPEVEHTQQGQEMFRNFLYRGVRLPGRLGDELLRPGDH